MIQLDSGGEPPESKRGCGATSAQKQAGGELSVLKNELTTFKYNS